MRFPVNSAIVPAGKLENDSYDWHERHAAKIAEAAGAACDCVLIGDSITHFWEGPSAANAAVYHRVFSGIRVLNLGFGFDRTQNVLWRLNHGEFGMQRPRLVCVNIGTNNLIATPSCRAYATAEIIEGIEAVCAAIHALAPDARILLTAAFPRGTRGDDLFRRAAELNAATLEHFEGLPGIELLDLRDGFLAPDGDIDTELLGDRCHPTPRGYELYGAALKPFLDTLRA